MTRRSSGPDLPTLAEVRRLLDASDPSLGIPDFLRRDPRASVAALVATAERRLARARQRETRRLAMLEMERDLYARGRLVVAGVDEAGLGPLAGPIVAAAVILGEAADLDGIDDSKKLDANTRERLAPQIRERATAFAIGIAEVAEIDERNVYHAGLLAMRRAVEGLALRPDHVLVDARRIPGIDVEQSAHVRGDARSLSIAAASILAKTFRDALMEELDRLHPGYGLARHKGYGTPEHQQALRRLGASPVHRMSYEAVRELVATAPQARGLGEDRLDGPRTAS
jgi:ribonuclease HII